MDPWDSGVMKASSLSNCSLIVRLIDILFKPLAAVCHPGADAGAHVPAQGVRAQPQGLPQNHALPEVAEDGRAPR